MTWCVVLLERHSSIVRLPGRLSLPEGAKAEKIRIKIEKLREAKAEARKRVLVARSCARVGKKDVIGGRV